MNKSRKELYADIKAYNLQEEVKKQCNDNYTRISSDKLEKIVLKYIEKNLQKDTKCNVNSNTTVKKNSKVVESDDKVDRLIYILNSMHILLDSQVKYIYSKK